MPQKPKETKAKFDVGKSLPNMGGTARPHSLASRTLPITPAEPPKKSRWKSWKFDLLVLFLVALILFVSSLAWVSYKFEKDCSKVFKDCTVFSLFDNTPLNGEDAGRVNILLAGNSADDTGHEGAKLTDSIMLISLNPQKHTGYMLSIPRDLYVNIPGIGHSKINAAYEDGGMSLLQKVVSKSFGVPINYYALVNYTAFHDAVDAVGGIDVTIKSPSGKLYDPNKDWRTGGPLVNLANGKHHLNGEQALDLSRARGDPSPYGEPIGFGLSDYQRTADQRLMLVALKQKATSFGTLVNPIKLGKLLDAVGKNVKTNFQGNNIHRLDNLIKSVPDNKLKSVGLNDIDGKGTSLLTSYMSYYSGDSLIPAAGLDNFSQIQNYIQTLNSR